jgi:hypothetical protein
MTDPKHTHINNVTAMALQRLPSHFGLKAHLTIAASVVPHFAVGIKLLEVVLFKNALVYCLTLLRSFIEIYGVFCRI